MSNLPVPANESALPVPIQIDLQFPVTQLNDVLRACNPGMPLTLDDPRRASLTELRDNIGINPFKRRLTMSLDAGDYHHFLLC